MTSVARSGAEDNINTFPKPVEVNGLIICFGNNKTNL